MLAFLTALASVFVLGVYAALVVALCEAAPWCPTSPAR